MFKFQLDYYRNGQGLHIKTILLTILSSIIMVLLMLIPGIAFIIGGFSLAASQDFSGEPSGGGIATFLISMVIGFILFILMYIFILIPIAYGILKFYKDTDLGISPRFSDLFMFLKKGNYVKTLKLTLIIGLISVATYFIVYIVVIIVEVIFFAIFGTSMALLQPSSGSEGIGAMSISFIVIMLFMILVLFALFIPLYYFVIFIVNTVLVHIDQRSLPTITKFSIGWNITSKGPHSAWKLLFSNLIYIVAAYIIIAIIGIIAAVIVSLMPSVIQILFAIIGYILFYLFMFAVFYFLYGSLMNFYHKNKNALYPKNN
ncbi:hypothetical protein [Mammaliicoccus vitulinus]|uniref:hypothetical protein n=1 Tax=Mammaliicoccus vitulinus TaxID=71237 RepID=UPI000F83D67E|nr:hypothetical protein [Mammaliicoccus vitulinus]QQT14756.1 hypothetical protein I6J10_09165 [Mammaliicoccus vitulinus]QQY19946.1 hypothetical protein I6J11_02625 [Mammaliicoccus vitulinus]RTX84816.1 hypothetical protein CD108_10115 [Mammaliicoccus vitulinus]GGI01491.1 hypothetical protein GCM10007366_13930 [Mammaliicoccus vitulinus]